MPGGCTSMVGLRVFLTSKFLPTAALRWINGETLPVIEAVHTRRMTPFIERMNASRVASSSQKLTMARPVGKLCSSFKCVENHVAVLCVVRLGSLVDCTSSELASGLVAPFSSKEVAGRSC